MTRTAVVRQPTPQQGRALEVLGHAIEYLIDNHWLRDSGELAHSDLDAVLILKKANQSVFLECTQVDPLLNRVLKRLQGKVLERQAKDRKHAAGKRPERRSGVHAIVPS